MAKARFRNTVPDNINSLFYNAANKFRVQMVRGFIIVEECHPHLVFFLVRTTLLSALIFTCATSIAKNSFVGSSLASNPNSFLVIAINIASLLSLKMILLNKTNEQRIIDTLISEQHQRPSHK